MSVRAPFPYFGGKGHRRVTEPVWQAFGPQVNNYVEPFCGSLGMLLARPGGAGKIETVNDAAAAISNVWRAIQADPDAVAKWCDRPVNEVDMHAVHRWLVVRLNEMQEPLREDMDFFDAKVAGLWLWGACIWIGGGWCGGVRRGKPRPNLLSQGVMAYSPGRRPSFSEQGVHLPSIGNDRGVNGVAAPPTLDWMRCLCERLRGVKVCSGDWSRVVTPSALGKGKNVGGRRPTAVFIDAPYPHEGRDPYLYCEDDAEVWGQSQAWAVENGDDPELRIAVCGYSGATFPSSWREYAWKASRGYAGADNENRRLERVWLSPFCLPIDEQRSLFSGMEAAP